MATETSVLTFVSVPGIAYRGDWTFLQLALGYILGRILVSIWLLPLYYKRPIQSIYEVLGERFGCGIQRTASLVFLVTRILADGVRFLATAVVVQVVTGWSIPAAVAIVGLVTIVYTLAGGIRTIIWMDSFQFGLYLSGAIISIIAILGVLPGAGVMIQEQLLNAGKMQIFHWGSDIWTNPWTLVSAVLGGMLLSFASHGTDYMMVQRVLSCGSLSGARKAMIGSGLFVFLQFSVFLFVGSLIYLLLPDANLVKDREFAYFIVNHLPTGLRGILLAGVLAAAMSTLSSSINSLASSTCADWLKGAVDVKRARLISLGWAAVLITIALLFDESDSAIVVVGLKIASYTYGGLLGLFILSQLPRKYRSTSLIIGLIGSVCTVFIVQQLGMAWTWFIGLAVIINLSLTHLVDILVDRFKTVS